MAKDNLDFDELDLDEVPELKVETENDFNGNEGEDDDFEDAEPITEAIAKETKAKGKGKGKSYTPPPPPPPPKKYEGVRHVIVYGDELFEVKDPNVTEEEIRDRVAKEFKYPEFSKDRTLFSLDEETGILTLGIKFEKKG